MNPVYVWQVEDEVTTSGHLSRYATHRRIGHETRTHVGALHVVKVDKGELHLEQVDLDEESVVNREKNIRTVHLYDPETWQRAIYTIDLRA
jgi:hypothetical protein